MTLTDTDILELALDAMRQVSIPIGLKEVADKLESLREKEQDDE